MKKIKYVISVSGSYVSDLNLRAATVNGRYWASYIPKDEVRNIYIDAWCTDSISNATGIALLVDGEVRIVEDEEE